MKTQRGSKPPRAVNHNNKRQAHRFYPELGKIRPVAKEQSRTKEEFQKLCFRIGMNKPSSNKKAAQKSSIISSSKKGVSDIELPVEVQLFL